MWDSATAAAAALLRCCLCGCCCSLLSAALLRRLTAAAVASHTFKRHEAADEMAEVASGLLLAPPSDPTVTVLTKLGLLTQRLRADFAANTANSADLLASDVHSAEGRLPARALWERIVSRTDEIYAVAETLLPIFAEIVTSLAGPTVTPEVSLKDPVRLHEKAISDYGDRFGDGGLPEACVSDVLR